AGNRPGRDSPAVMIWPLGNRRHGEAGLVGDASQMRRQPSRRRAAHSFFFFFFFAGAAPSATFPEVTDSLSSIFSVSTVAVAPAAARIMVTPPRVAAPPGTAVFSPNTARPAGYRTTVELFSHGRPAARKERTPGTHQSTTEPSSSS